MHVEYIVLCLELSKCSVIVNDDDGDVVVFSCYVVSDSFATPWTVLARSSDDGENDGDCGSDGDDEGDADADDADGDSDRIRFLFFFPQSAFPAHAALTIPPLLRLASSLPRALSAQRAFHNLSQVCRKHSFIAFLRVLKSSPCRVLSDSCSWSMSTIVSSTLLFLPSVNISSSAWDSNLEMAFP